MSCWVSKWRIWVAAVGLVFATAGAAQAQCVGKERWAVKTGGDRDATKVDLSQLTNTTVADLVRFNPPPHLPSSSRIEPVETTAFRVRATLVEFRLEEDQDYHLVLEDHSGDTMIAEIPSPQCVDPASPFYVGIAAVRAIFESQFQAGRAPQRVAVPVEVVGVGFFDFIHGQSGVAPNGIELHPVVGLSFIEEAGAVAAQSAPRAPPANALSNADVRAMLAAGLDSSVVLAKIQTSPAAYDTSPAALIALKDAGVSAEILTAMVYRQSPVGESRGGARAGSVSAQEGSGSTQVGAGSVRGFAGVPGDGTETVYVTASGTKYHRAGCRYLSRGGRPIALSEAVRSYQPCSVCNPPVMDSGQEGEAGVASPGAAAVQPAPAGASGTPTGETTTKGQPIYVGPRGGRYHYSASGKKVYEKKR